MRYATYNQQLALWQTLGDRTKEAETLYNIALQNAIEMILTLH
ncbi:hypothetical protein [Nostoc sp.]